MRTATSLLVGGATAAAGLAYLAYVRQQEKAIEEEDDDSEDVEEMPSVGPETVSKIFDKLRALMNANIAKIMRRINAQGGQVPQALLTQYLVEHFETQLREIQALVFKEFDVTEEEMEEAVEYYEATREASVVESVNQLRQLYVNVGGSIELDLPEDFDVDKMCLVFGDYMAAVTEAQAAFSQQLQMIKAKGGQVTAAQLSEAREAMMQEKISVVLKKHNLTTLLFQAAIEKYNDHPTFQQKVASVKANEVNAAAAAAGRT